MVKPEQRNVPFIAPWPPYSIGEMAEQRGTGVLLVAALDAKFIRQHGVASARINHKTRTPFGLAAIVGLHFHQRAFVTGYFARFHIHMRDALPFKGARTTLGGVTEQHFIEFRTAHMHCIREGFIHRLGKEKIAGVVMPRRHKLGAIFSDAQRFNFFAHPQPVKQRHVHRQ